jgi:formate dehydrogenase
VTAIEADRIRDIARGFARSGGSFCHLSTGVNQGTFHNIAYAAKIALELVTGNLDRAGGALLPLGAVDTATLARRLGFDREPSWKSRIGGFSPVVGTLPTPILADEILTPGDGKIRALFVVSGNPRLSAPDGKRLEKAFGELELLVSLDLFVNDTATQATHVLPCTDFLERDDMPLPMLQLMPVPYLQWTDAVVPPRGERRPEWRIFADLARHIGVPLFGSRIADLFVRSTLKLGGSRGFLSALLAPTLGPGAIGRLAKHPHGKLVDRERPGDFLERRIGTRSRKVELFPPDVWSRLTELEALLDRMLKNQTSDGKLRLRLFTKRERLGHNSWMHCNPRLSTPEHAAYLSPADAALLGVASGGRLRLSNAHGSIELPAVVTSDVIDGAISVPHGYGHAAESGWQAAVGRGGQNVNELAASGPTAIDPLSGMTQYVGVPVDVEAVAAGARAAE